MSDKEDAFWREVDALAEYDERKQLMDPTEANYTEMAAYFREIARRAMTCAFRAEEAAQEVGEGRCNAATARPALEPE